MQAFSQAFEDQTDQCIRNRVRHQYHGESKRVMHARYRDGTSYTDKGPHLPDWVINGMRGRGSQDCPQACDREAYKSPDRNSEFHTSYPRIGYILRPLAGSINKEKDYYSMGANREWVLAELTTAVIERMTISGL